MNRRSFISSMLAFSVAPHFLPGAGRIWKSEARIKGMGYGIYPVNPEWVKAPYSCYIVYDQSQFQSPINPNEMEIVPKDFIGECGYVMIPDTAPMRFKLDGDRFVPLDNPQG